MTFASRMTFVQGYQRVQLLCLLSAQAVCGWGWGWGVEC